MYTYYLSIKNKMHFFVDLYHFYTIFLNLLGIKTPNK